MKGEKMIKEKFDAVIFDLDGTLVDSMWVWDKTWGEGIFRVAKCSKYKNGHSLKQ